MLSTTTKGLIFLKDFNTSIFAERLKKARTDKKLKQSELAELAGVSKATISSYERTEGAKIPSLDNAYLLAKALDAPLEWLCGEEKAELDYTDFDVQTYLKALVIVISEMSVVLFDNGTITFDSEVILNFIEKITDLLKVYRTGGSAIDKELFKTCVDKTINNFSALYSMYGSRFVSHDELECAYQDFMNLALNTSGEIGTGIYTLDVCDIPGADERKEFFISDKEIEGAP